MPNGGSSMATLSKIFKGKYLSLYIIVVPGKYDGMLPWPMAEEIRVTLIDQYPRQDAKKNISKVIDFKNDQRPRPQTESNIGLGFGNFVHQNTLHTQSYLNDNTMYIMVSKNNAQ